MARKVGLSRNHFLGVFRQETGETPHRLLLRLRTERARDELHHGAEPITKVARRCGYADAAEFSRAFRREVGATPSAYRGPRRR